MQDFVPVPTPNGERIWTHTDLVEGGCWTIIVTRKKKRIGENLGCHVISLGIGEYDTSNSLLTDLEDEQIVQMANPVKGTW